MPLLLVLVIVLPTLLLLLGVGLGAAGTWWWWVRRSRPHEPAAPGEVSAAAAEAAALAAALEAAEPLATWASLPHRKDSKLALPPCIHIAASCASLQPPSTSAPSSTKVCAPVGLCLAASPPARPAGAPAARSRRHLPAPLRTPSPGILRTAMQAAQPADGSAGASTCGGEPAVVLQPVRVGHRKTASMDLGQLVRAGPSVISQVREARRGVKIVAPVPGWYQSCCSSGNNLVHALPRLARTHRGAPPALGYSIALAGLERLHLHTSAHSIGMVNMQILIGTTPDCRNPRACPPALLCR